MKKKRTTKSATRTKKRTTAATRTKKRVLKAANTAIKRRSPVTVSSRRHVSTARNHRYHSPRTHRTSRSHIGSIIKGIILFLGVVLLLAILASIFMPSARHYIPDTLNQTGTMGTQPTQRLAPRNFNRSYVTPEVNTNNQGSVSSENAPADQY